MQLIVFVEDPESFRSRSWTTDANTLRHGVSTRVIAQDTFRYAKLMDQIVVTTNENDILEHARRNCPYVRLLVSMQEGTDGISLCAEHRQRPGAFEKRDFSDTELAAGEVVRWLLQCLKGSVTVESTSGAGGHSEEQPTVPTPSLSTQTEFVATEEAEAPPVDDEVPEVKPRARRKSRKSD